MTSSSSTIAPMPINAGLETLSKPYKALFCDVWGVLIDGKRHFPRAVDALRRFRAQGGCVVLITNASRPDSDVRRQLTEMGLPSDCYDDLVSAGELTLAEMLSRRDQSCYHLGPSRDNGLFEEASQRLGTPIHCVSFNEADYCVCTGLFEERVEKPQDYDDLLTKMAARGLEMLCANPDIIVAIGEEIVYCAGALAQRYALLGGKVLMFGKPHPPIYAAAFERLRRLRGQSIDPKDVLAIGDGGATDLAGAGRAGIDCLFITEGVHEDELITPDAEINPAGLARLINSAGARPCALAGEVFW